MHSAHLLDLSDTQSNTESVFLLQHWSLNMTHSPLLLAYLKVKNPRLLIYLLQVVQRTRWSFKKWKTHQFQEITLNLFKSWLYFKISVLWFESRSTSGLLRVCPFSHVGKKKELKHPPVCVIQQLWFHPTKVWKVEDSGKSDFLFPLTSSNLM